MVATKGSRENPIPSVCAVIRRRYTQHRGPEVFFYALLFNVKRNQWEFPGGKMDPGETIYEAVSREVGEEIGEIIRDEIGLDWSHLGTITHKSSDGFWYKCAVMVSDKEGPISPRLRSSKEGESHWFRETNAEEALRQSSFRRINEPVLMSINHGVPMADAIVTW